MVKRDTLAAAGCRRMVAAGIVLAAIISCANAADPEATPVAHIEKVVGTPHFYQSDPRGQFPGKGQNYCCPTAASDSLAYLAAQGFPKLLPHGMEDPVETHITLIKELASPGYMKTDPATGTGPGQMCAGIQRYVETCGYVCKTIEYRGWRSMPKALKSYAAAPLPSLVWIRKAAADNHSAVWVNIGWYVRGAAAEEWKRVGGHWVSVIGYGVDGAGRENPDVLLIDNPAVPAADRAGKESPERRRLADGTQLPTGDEIAADVMATEPVGQGRLVGDEAGLPRDAGGMYRVSGQGVRMSKSYDAAFLDGAIVLVIGDHRP